MREETFPTARDYTATCAMKMLSAQGQWKRTFVKYYVTLPLGGACKSMLTLIRLLARSRSTQRSAFGDDIAALPMVAAADHDSVLVAAVCPSAMLFVPSVDGITHNPKEYSTKEHLARGAQVLLDAVLTLAR